MGKADIAVKNWLNDNERFADLFNGTVFDGQQIILPDELENLDRETDILITDKKNRRRGLQRHRDLAKRWRGQVDLAILACENQNHIHYAMPVRGMLNDSLTYTDQIREIWRQHEKELNTQRNVENPLPKWKFTHEEYLSRFQKDDKIFPVLNLVLYYGLKRWDGPENLYDMFQLNGNLKDLNFLHNFIPNYHINLLDAGSFSAPERFHSDLQQIFGVLKYREDKNAMQEYMLQNRQYFENVDVETYQAMREFMHSESVMKNMENKTGKETKINMCKALEDIYEDGQKLLVRNMLRNGMSAEDIKKYAGVTDQLIAEAQKQPE